MAIPFVLKKLIVRTGAARFLPAARRIADGGIEFLPYYSDRVLAAPVDELLDPATFPESPGADVVNLNLPAPAFESPVSGGRLAADRTGRPPAWGLPSLRRAISERAGAEDVFVTHGATAAFAAVLDAFVNPGDRVVLFDPCSPLFELGAKSRRAKVRRVPTSTANGKLVIDPEALTKTLRGAMLLAFADPANPTGGVLTNEDAEKIAWAAGKADVLVYRDESFGRFRYDGPAAKLAAFPGSDRRLLTAGSLTQGYGLGSVRVGWLSGPRHLVKACALTANLTAPYVPTLCQQIALRAVQADEELFGPVLEEFRAKRRYTFDRLNAMGFNPTWPGGGFFVWVPVGHLGLDGRRFAEQLLRQKRVLVGPGCAFGGADHLRISFATEDGRLREGLARMAEFVAGLKGKPTAEGSTAAEVETAEADPRPPAFSRV